MSVQEEPTAIRPTKGPNAFTSKEQDGDTEVALYPDRSDPVRRLQLPGI
jgi:hypothetical protein